MILYDVIIIGAGPAGLFTALQAGQKSAKILVLEKQPHPGLKLLLTGSGQCNFTNIRPIREFPHAYGEHGSFLKPALMHFSNQDAIAFFKQHGIEPMVIDENGKVFPKSLQARDILNALLSACKERKVAIRFQQKVTRIGKHSSGLFQVQTATETYETKNLVIATGGKSYPGTGSSGDGYGLAQALGHSLVAPRPGLTPFYIKNFPLADLTGTAFKDLAVALWRENKKVKTLSGDLLITAK
ncbi:MAG: aminoacetone oxidase family FAD-binding enzyme, partial [Desulfobacteraceae bacterium]